MLNILDDSSNKTQAIIKLEIAKENLEGVQQALSEYNKPRLDKTIKLIEEVLTKLKKEMEC